MASNFSCGVFPVTAVGAACSGNGLCVELTPGQGVCLCNDGWQGECDFQVTNSALDCQINTTAIRAMWIVVLIGLLAFFLVFHLPYGRWLWAKHQSLVTKNRQAGKRYRLYDNKGLFAMLPYLTVAWPAMIALTIVKIVDQNLKLGHSVLVTILYIIWRFCFFFGPDIFQPALLSTLLKTERTLDHIIRINWQFNIAHLVFVESLSILVIIPMVVEQDPFVPVVGMTSFAVFANLIALAFIALAIQARYIGHRVQMALVSSFTLNRDERTNKIMSKIRNNQATVIKGTVAQTLIFGTFGCFPYMWNKHDYLMPISILFSAAQVMVALKSLVQEENKTSTNKSSEAAPGSNDKKVANRAPDDSIVDSQVINNKPPFVHGLEMDPMHSEATGNGNTLYSSGDGETPMLPPPPQPGESFMKLLRSLTPSRKEAAKQRFDFSEENDDDENK